MKVSPANYQRMQAAIMPFDTMDARVAYRRGDFPRADMVKDLDKRYRWDLFWIAFRADEDMRTHVFSGGYDDAHLDTALRRIVPPLTV